MNFCHFISILEEISTSYDDIVVIGDFNNNLLVDNLLIEPMLSLHLDPVNVSTPTHYCSTSCSLIDLIFVNHRAKVLLYDQISASCFSNHDLLFLNYNLFMRTVDRQITYRDFQSINYTTLHNNIDNICWDRIYALNNINDQLSLIQQNVRFLYDICVPVRTKLIRGDRQPWFNAEIKRLIERRDNAYSRWKRFKTDELKSVHKSARREVTKRIKLEKTLFYGRKFSTAMDNKYKWKEIRKIGIGQKYQKTADVDVDANALNNKFVNVNVPTPVGNIYDDLCYVPLENPFSFRCVNQLEVLDCLSSVKSNAIGCDDLDPRFVRALTPKLLPYYTHLFNTVLTKSTFPDDWKQSKIIPIPKTSSEFRPIAILPFLSKVMESLIARQINEYLKSYDLLSDKQSGFRRARSCTTALVNMVEDLRSELDEDYIAPLVLLDHTKAFDTVDHKILVKKLQKFFHFSNSACNLISSYLTHRHQRVYLNNIISEPLNLSRGVPQGSILGPLLFCTYINDLPDVLVDCNIHMYADDVQLYTSTRIENISFCIDSINNDLQRIDSWAASNGLCINPSKSKCILLSRSNRSITVPDIAIKGNRIDFVKSAPNLGVVFNSRLSWSDHINIIVGRVYSMLRNLWAVIDSTPFAIRMQLAKTYLVPVLLYGCEIYANCDGDDKRKLNVAFNNIARYVFLKGRRDHISHYSYRIFGVNFENLLKIKCLVFLHRIITSKQPVYLFSKLCFARSSRGKKIIQKRYRTLLSERQFYIHTTRLWNFLPNHIQNIGNANVFKKELYRVFS